jgi:hypothetical protein
MPFLTELDERAEVKGSRDPLGIVPVWSKFGREVVGNLTTVTNSVRGFTTLLIGVELADMLREQLRMEAPPILETFMRFEQLAGYARVRQYKSADIRGIRRVTLRLNEGGTIRISAESGAQILSNQKTYGLWGLFTMPARSCGLLEKGQSRLTPESRVFIERHYFPQLGGTKGINALLDRLRKESFKIDPHVR